MRKHLRAVLAGKKLQLDDSATTRATLLTVGGAGDPSSPGLRADGRVGSCEDQTMFHGLCILAHITGQKHPRSSSVQPQLCLQGLRKMGVRAAIYNNQKQCPQGVRCFHSVRARECSLFATKAPVCSPVHPSPVLSWGLLRGQCRPLWLLLTNSLLPFSTSAPSTATTPTAKGQTCSAPPWASPQPLWTVPPGQAPYSLFPWG